MSTRVYVGGLSSRAREKDLERFFRKYGRLRDIALKNGYAFVEFDDYRDADDACYELSGKDLLGERITIELARGTPHGRDKEKWGVGDGRRSRSRERGGGGRDRGGGGDRGGRRPIWLDKYGPPTRTDYRVIVENLSSRVSWQDLKDFMRQAGDVTYADAHKSHRNQGVVEFSSYEEMKNCISKLDDTELNGRRIHIIEDKSAGGGSKRGRTRSRSKQRSRSRSRSRSPSRRRSRSDRSDSRRREKSKSKSRTRSRSRTKSKSRSASRSRTRSRSRSRSNRSRSHSNNPKSDRSRSRSGSRSKSRNGHLSDEKEDN